jgi:hypothetical protein
MIRGNAKAANRQAPLKNQRLAQSQPLLLLKILFCRLLREHHPWRASQTVGN